VYVFNLLQVPNVAWQSYLQLSLHFPSWILGLTVTVGSFMTFAGVLAYKYLFFKVRAVLYCAVLCCTVLYCAVLYCAVLCCAVLYCAVLYCAVLYCVLRSLPCAHCLALVCCAVLCCLL
jgi:hypothetical protein